MNFTKLLKYFKIIILLSAIEGFLFLALLYHKAIFTNNTKRDIVILDRYVFMSLLFLLLLDLHNQVLMIWCGIRLTFTKNNNTNISTIYDNPSHELSLENGSRAYQSPSEDVSLKTYEGICSYTKKNFPWIKINRSDGDKSNSLLKIILSTPAILIFLGLLFFVNLFNQAIFVGLSWWDYIPIFSYSFFPVIAVIGAVSVILRNFIPFMMLRKYQGP